jgi:hypothetical protein
MKSCHEIDPRGAPDDWNGAGETVPGKARCNWQAPPAALSSSSLLARQGVAAYLFGVAQIFNLLYRRFPIGKALNTRKPFGFSTRLQAGSAAIRQVGNPRYVRERGWFSKCQGKAAALP